MGGDLWQGSGSYRRGTGVSADQVYDTIGASYLGTRRTEPRIAARIWAALGGARTVLNVGAGTGSYEPPDRDVTAVEPSAVMRAQRPPSPAPCPAPPADTPPFPHHPLHPPPPGLSPPPRPPPPPPRHDTPP